MCKIKIVVFAIAILLPSCFNIADVNWRDELENTHWSNCNTNEQFIARVSQLNSHIQGYGLVNGKIVPLTILDKEGMQIMEYEGCLGCHQDGGALSSILSVMRNKVSEISR